MRTRGASGATLAVASCRGVGIVADLDSLARGHVALGRGRKDSGGSIRWEGTSLVGVLYRREQIDSPLLVQQYLLWRPQLSSTTTIELPIWDRWPYGGLGACGVSTEDVVPTPTRLWLVRSVQCSDDPEFGSEVRARLHAFAEDGSDVTPPEGIPLARVMWSQEVRARV